MDNKVKISITRTDITGTINGAEIRINYENKVGAKPEQVTANATVADPAAVVGTENPGMMRAKSLGTITMTQYATGEKSVKKDGKIPLKESQALELALDAELTAILG